MQSYNYTGANIPIDLNTAIIYVIKLLKEYDENLAKGILIKNSPYNDKITMKMDDNNIIEIPYEIQREAIKKWEIMKVQVEYDKEKKTIEERILSLSDELNNMVESFDNDNNEDHTFDNYFYIKIFVIILIIGIGIYLYTKKS